MQSYLPSLKIPQPCDALSPVPPPCSSCLRNSGACREAQWEPPKVEQPYQQHAYTTVIFCHHIQVQQQVLQSIEDKELREMLWPRPCKTLCLLSLASCESVVSSFGVGLGSVRTVACVGNGNSSRHVRGGATSSSSTNLSMSGLQDANRSGGFYFEYCSCMQITR